MTVAVEEGIWRQVKARASETGKSIPEAVEWAFRLYLGNQKPLREEPVPLPRDVDTLSPVERLSALVNQRVGGGVIKTAKQVAMERERMRGDESGSQVPYDEEE